jgi:hypothetical protein
MQLHEAVLSSQLKHVPRTAQEVQPPLSPIILRTSRDIQQHGPRDSPAPSICSSMRTVTASGSGSRLLTCQPQYLLATRPGQPATSSAKRTVRIQFDSASLSCLDPPQPMNLHVHLQDNVWPMGSSEAMSSAPAGHELHHRRLNIDEASRFQCQGSLECPVIQRVRSRVAPIHTSDTYSMTMCTITAAVTHRRVG